MDHTAKNCLREFVKDCQLPHIFIKFEYLGALTTENPQTTIKNNCVVPKLVLALIFLGGLGHACTIVCPSSTKLNSYAQ